MQKYLFIYAVLLTALLVYGWRHYHRENERLSQNQTSLSSQIKHYRTQADKEAASAQVLRLRCGEFEELRAEDALHIRALGLKIRRLEASAKTVTTTNLEARTLTHDTVIVRVRDSLIIRDTLQLFRWHDPWVAIEGVVSQDSVLCRIESCDTLRQVVHRIPRRFLFFRWGTKALRQEVTSANPHTRIVYSEYVKIEK